MRHNLIISSLLIAIGCTTAGVFIGQGIKNFKNGDRVVTIKGLAEQVVKSDYCMWSLGFRQAGNDFNEVQVGLNKNRKEIIDFLKSQGLKDDEIEILPLNITDQLAREYGSENVARRFVGNSAVWVKSSRVDIVQKANTKIDSLIQSGVMLFSDTGSLQPKYMIKGFNEIKSTLLSQSIKNAKDQAQKFASDSNAELGKLKRANQGVIRILDDDGTSDDSNGKTINQKVRVVSTFDYFIK